MTHTQNLHAALRERRLLKVIAGIENFELANVLTIAHAAKQGGAQAIDVAADAEIIRAVKAETDLIVFVSAVEPAKLVAAAEAGADVLELGNFDAMYKAGHYPTKAEILSWAREVKAAVGDRVPLCVTVSGQLSLADQLDLATQLQAAGVDMLQTEGQVGPEGDDAYAALSNVTRALANTAEIRKVVDLPLMLAGGFNVHAAPYAIAAGADALGVGKAITRLGDLASMTEATRAIVVALDAVTAAGKGLARS